MFAIFLIAVVPLTLFNGWVLSVMWNWFVPLAFSSVPKLAIGKAIGLSLVISAFLYVPSKDDKDKDPWARFIVELSSPVIRGLFLLLFGAVVHGIIA